MQTDDFSKLSNAEVLAQALPGDSVEHAYAIMRRCPDCGMPAWWATDTCRHCGWHIRCANRTDNKTGKKNPNRPARFMYRQRVRTFYKRLAERGEDW